MEPITQDPKVIHRLFMKLMARFPYGYKTANTLKKIKKSSLSPETHGPNNNNYLKEI